MAILKNRNRIVLTSDEIRDVIERKSTMRQTMRDARYSLAFDDWLAKSDAITKRVLSLPSFKEATRVCCYIHKEVTREPSTSTIINSILDDSKKEIAVPITRIDKFDLDLSLITSRDDLVIGAFNVLEPIPTKEDLVDANSCDFFIIPCLAVDAEGYRLGYGKGYFDKLLSKLERDVPVIALAFDFQVLHAVPALNHDIPVTAIVTESRYIQCESPNQDERQ